MLILLSLPKVIFILSDRIVLLGSYSYIAIAATLASFPTTTTTTSIGSPIWAQSTRTLCKAFINVV